MGYEDYLNRYWAAKYQLVVNNGHLDFLVEMLRFRGHVGALYIHGDDAQQDD